MISRFLFPWLLCFPWAAFALQETWETGYAKDGVTGKHVLGHWSFEKEDGLELNGAVLNAKGRLGGGLESFPGFPVQGMRHAACGMRRWWRCEWAETEDEDHGWRNSGNYAMIAPL